MVLSGAPYERSRAIALRFDLTVFSKARWTRRRCNVGRSSFGLHLSARLFLDKTYPQDDDVAREITETQESLSMNTRTPARRKTIPSHVWH